MFFLLPKFNRKHGLVGNLEEGSSMVIGRAGFDTAFPVSRFVFNQIADEEADDKIRDSAHQYLVTRLVRLLV